jgi:thiamine-monophosphate kinase
MCDVSDGLLADLGHIAAGSRVTIDLDGAALEHACLEPPGALQQVSAALGVDPMSWVLTGGEDHALVATFPARAVLPEGWTAIGSVRTGPRKAGVFVDGRPAAEVVSAVGAEGTGHVHF